MKPAAAFLLLLGAAGGIEGETLPLLPGLDFMAFALILFAATINRRKEVHIMSTTTKGRIIRYLADIHSPASLNNIEKQVYRQFLKSPVSVEPDYFCECLKLPPDVPGKHLPDLYSIILGLARPEKEERT